MSWCFWIPAAKVRIQMRQEKWFLFHTKFEGFHIGA